MPQSRYASWFTSHEVMWKARENFLESFKSEMDDWITNKPNKVFERTLEYSNVGGGFALSNNGSIYHYENLNTVTYRYRYSDSDKTWYEITAFPIVKDAFNNPSNNGTVIEL